MVYVEDGEFEYDFGYDLVMVDFYDLFFEGFDVFYFIIFKNYIMWCWFEWLCKEDFVYYMLYSEFGFYWLIIKYKDIMDVDINYKVFLFELIFGGIIICD